MNKTPWAKGSLPSDRVPGRPPSAKSKGKQSKNNAEPPKSAQVVKLEQQISALTTASLVDPDPKGGCYCQARTHDLSKFTPLCTSCGLVICAVNGPQFSCPHCCYPLLSNAAREGLVVQLEQDLAAMIAKEAEDKERAVEEARRAAGAFPTLAGPAMGAGAAAGPVAHKVMSLGKKVVISSYTTAPAVRKEEEPVAVERAAPPGPRAAARRRGAYLI